MQALSPAEEAWSYAWDYTMGAPDKALWDYPIGAGSATMDGNEGLHVVEQPPGISHAGLRFKDYAAWLGQKAVCEIEVKVISAYMNGFRILCTSGSNGVSDGHGLQVTLNEGYLNMLTRGMNLSTITKTAPLTYGEWHKVKFELDTIAGANKVYLDDILVDTVNNANLSTNYVSSVWCLIQTGECYVRAVRYRKED